MKTCYVLPLLPSFSSSKAGRGGAMKKIKNRGGMSVKKDRKRVRASIVLLQKREKKKQRQN